MSGRSTGQRPTSQPRVEAAVSSSTRETERETGRETERETERERQRETRPDLRVRAPAAANERPVVVTTARERFVDVPRSPTMTRVGVGLAAGGVVALGVAGTLGYLASRDFDRAQGLGCDADAACPVGPAADQAERANDRARLAQLSALGGGALLATGATLFFLGRSTTRMAAPDVTLSVTSSSLSIGWSLQ